MMILITVLILGVSAAIMLHTLNSGDGCDGERAEILAAYRLGRESGGLSHDLFIEDAPEFFVLESGPTTKAIERLRQVPADRVVPGHGPVSAQWPSALEDEERYFGLLVRDIRRLLAEGGSLQQATDTIGGPERNRWQLFDSYNARNVTAAYTELEWE